MFRAIAQSLDGIIDTVSAKHPLGVYLNTLKVGGVCVMLGAPDEPMDLPTFDINLRRLRIGGSVIGGIKETQEMLNFCGKHNITCEIEDISIDYVNTAMERLVKKDVHYRFVIDVQGLDGSGLNRVMFTKRSYRMKRLSRLPVNLQLLQA
ncbi:hypothetical protein WJX79_004389 [Trebouxia sp. C0005]